MKNFEGLGLHPQILKSLERMNFTAPTPVQAQAIPHALEGRDILGSAQTGTGKTGAFSIPMIQSLLDNPQGSALVLTPTRELARQVMETIHAILGPKSDIKTAFLIGGESMGKQLNQLKQRPRVIIGTPGRINDHLERGTLRLNDAGFLVLDETDRMLDMGFGIQLERIFKHMPKQKQTLMFSATLPREIVRLSENYLNNPVRVAVGSTTKPMENIKQEVIRLTEDEKYDELLRQLDTRAGSIIIFVKTKFGADRLAKRLNREDHSAEAIHGDLKQSKRDRVIREFRNMDYRILVATDVAARGLDIPHIEHVINYDLPQVPEDYIHRIGRTARAGAEGSALCLLTPQDGRKWFAIECLINPDAKPERPQSFGARKPARRPARAGGAPSGRSDKPWGNKPREDRPREDRPREDRPKRAFTSDQPRAERVERPRDDRPREDRPARAEFRPRSDAPRSDAPRGDRPREDRPQRAERPERTEKSGFAKPWSDKPKSDKPAFGKPQGARPEGKKPFGAKQDSGKPQGERAKFGGKPAGGKPAGAKRFGNGGGNPNGNSAPKHRAR